jgi:hypothetical protein
LGGGLSCLSFVDIN